MREPCGSPQRERRTDDAADSLDAAPLALMTVSAGRASGLARRTDRQDGWRKNKIKAVSVADDLLIGADGLLLPPSGGLQDLFLLEANAAKIYLLAAFAATFFRVSGVL